MNVRQNSELPGLYFSGYKYIWFVQDCFFFLAVGNTFHFNWELSRSLFDASQVKEMTSQDGIWIVIVLYFHSLTSVNYRAIQYSDVRAFWREQSAPEVPLRAFYHIWRWMARLSRNDDVRGRCRAGPPRSSRTAWWWRHSDAAVAREGEENTTTRWLRKEIRVT